MLFPIFLSLFFFSSSFFCWWFEIKSITSSHSKWWIIQTLHAHYTHIFTEQYDDHDDFPIQSKQGECYKFWDTKALYTIYITSTHNIQYISLRRCLYGFLVLGRYIYFIFLSRKKKGEKSTWSFIFTYKTDHFRGVCLLYSEVNICWRLNIGKREREKRRRGRSLFLNNLVFLPCVYIYLIDYFCYVCLKWWHSLMSE